MKSWDIDSPSVHAAAKAIIKNHRDRFPNQDILVQQMCRTITALKIMHENQKASYKEISAHLSNMKVIVADLKNVAILEKVLPSEIESVQIRFKKSSKYKPIKLSSELAIRTVVNPIKKFHLKYKRFQSYNANFAESFQVGFLQQSLLFLSGMLNSIMGIEENKKPTSYQFEIMLELYAVIGEEIKGKNPVEYLRTNYKRGVKFFL
jgi:hypothetical protein